MELSFILIYLIFPTLLKLASRDIEVNMKKRKNKMYFLKMHAIKQRSSDASRYHQAIAINSG